MAGVSKVENFGGINPGGLVATLRGAGMVVFEVGTICRYKPPTTGYPEGSLLFILNGSMSAHFRLNDVIELRGYNDKG